MRSTAIRCGLVLTWFSKLNILNGLNLSSLHNNTTKESFPALVGERLVPYGGSAAAVFNAAAVMANST